MIYWGGPGEHWQLSQATDDHVCAEGWRVNHSRNKIMLNKSRRSPKANEPPPREMTDNDQNMLLFTFNLLNKIRAMKRAVVWCGPRYSYRPGHHHNQHQMMILIIISERIVIIR